MTKTDPSARERNRTHQAAKASGLKWDTCWTCGITHTQIPVIFGRSANINRHHILPLEEGGSSDPNNLVPLCSRSGKRDADPSLLRCHQLVHLGGLSCNEMMILIKYGFPDPTARQRMIETVQLARKLNLVPYGSQSTVKQEHRLKNELQKANTTEDRFCIRTELANHWRRRPHSYAIKNARRHINLANELLDGIKDLYKRSNFFYQKAYIETLEGNADEAVRCFEQSIQELEALGGDIPLMGYISKAQMLVVKGLFMSDAQGVAGREVENQWQNLTKTFQDYSNDAQKRIANESQTNVSELDTLRVNLADANRWIQSCHIHRAMFAVKRKRLKLARQELAAWSKIRSNLTIKDGWAIAQAPIASITHGIIAAHDINLAPENVKSELEILAHGIRMLLLNSKSWPETIRDGLFALGILCKRSGLSEAKKLSKRVLTVARSIHDPLSGIMGIEENV